MNHLPAPGLACAIVAASALAAAGACLPDLLPDAHAHTTTVTVTEAALVDDHTVKISYSDYMGSSAGSTSYQNLLRTYQACERGVASDCNWLVTHYNHSFYNNLNFTWSGAKKIIFVEDGGGRSDLLHIDPRHPISTHSAGTVHIEGGVYSCDRRQCGQAHVHRIHATTIPFIDALGPSITGTPRLDLRTPDAGKLHLTLNKNVGSVDTSKIYVAEYVSGGYRAPDIHATSSAVSCHSRMLCFVYMTGASASISGRNVTVTMTEEQRAAINIIDGYASGNRNISMYLGKQAGATTNAGGANNSVQSVTAYSVTRDTHSPVYVTGSSTLDISTGKLNIAFNEIMNVATADVSKIRLEGCTPNARPCSSSGYNMSLAGASLPATNSKVVALALTPAQKAHAIDPVSFPPGAAFAFADKAAFPDVRVTNADVASKGLSLLKLQPNAFRDGAGNAFTHPNGHAAHNTRTSGQSGLYALSVVSDTAAPTVTGSALDLGAGTLRIELDEFVRARTADTSKISIHATGGSVALSADNHLRSDGDTIVVELTEQQRQRLIALGRSLTLSVASGAVSDLVGNQMSAVSGMSMQVVPDRNAPTFVRATVSGTSLTVTFSETIDVTPASKVNLAGLGIRLASQQASAATGLSGTLSTGSDGATLAFDISSTTLSQSSGTLVLDIGAGAVLDTSGNRISAAQGNTVTATADTAPPTFVTASLDMRSGVMTLTFNETIDATPASLVHLSKISVRNGNSGDTTTMTSATVAETDSSTIRITMTEQQRRTVSVYQSPTLYLDTGAVADLAGNLFVAPS